MQAFAGHCFTSMRLAAAVLENPPVAVLSNLNDTERVPLFSMVNSSHTIRVFHYLDTEIIISLSSNDIRYRHTQHL